jgi:single-strand DNA-binding protein
MARGVNKVILIGNVGSDPEIRYSEGGDPVANFSLATSETWNDKNGEKQEKTEWHKIVIWRKLAEVVKEYVKKGDKLYLEGKLQTRQWDKEGTTMYTTEVQVFQMEMLGSKEGASGGGSNHAKQSQSPPPGQGSTPNNSPSASQAGIDEDDLPF